MKLPDEYLMEMICHPDEEVWKLGVALWNKAHPEDPIKGETK